MGMSKIVKLIILVILLAVFGKYIYQYLKRKGGGLFSFTEKAGSFIKRGVVKSIAAVGIGDTVKKVEAKLSPSPTPAPPTAERTSTLAEPINAPRPPVNAAQPVMPDSSTRSAIQKPPQKGYCYVGTDRGYRSCIYVKDRKSCMSGQVFPMKEVCEYPGLRPGTSRSSGWYYYKNGRYQLYNPEPYFNDHYYQQGSQSGYNGSSQSGYNGSSRSGYNGSSQSGYNGSSQSGYNGSSRSGYNGSSQSGYNGSSQSGYNGSSQSGYNGSSQSGYNGSSKSGYNGDQFDFTRYYDMRGAGDKSYNRNYNGTYRDRNYNGTYRDRDDYYNRYGSKTKSMSQYIAQQDRNAKYGGRGESMPTYDRQRSSSPILYSS